MNLSCPFWDEWQLEFHSGIPVHKQIINRVCSALASGQLKPGDQLPTIRNLQEKLGVNPNTVAKAYRELELRGMLTSERGSGSFISDSAQGVEMTREEKLSRVEAFYQRMLTEAAGSGITESDLIEYIKNKARS